MSPENTRAKFGRYEIISRLGKGGMGTVYKAKDPVLGRHVALKVAHASAGGDKESAMQHFSRYLQEARLAAKFVHPNIAVTYDAGFENDQFYMAMEYINGTDLQKFTRKANLLPRIQVLEMLYNICYALEYIHKNGYVHLDVKPSNIMMTDKGEAKLMDFGISRLVKKISENKGEISGSVFYMSPEQTNPQKCLNHGSDIFSLGVVAYQLFTGERPFDGDTPVQVFNKIMNRDPVPMHEIVPDISMEIEHIVSKALSKKSGDRFQSAKDFADALLPVIKGKDSTALDKEGKKKIEYLKRLLFFRQFQFSDLEEVLRLSSWSFHLKDTWIMENSENDKNIYMVITGKAAVHIGRDIKHLKPGDCFGEAAVLHNIPKNAKLKAETDCVVMVINASILNQADPAIQVKFLKEFYLNKTLQLVDANLKLIQKRISNG